MKSKRDNKIILDINKAQWCRFYYRNQFGHTRDTKLPHTHFSCNGVVHHREDKAFPHPDYPNEFALGTAIRLGVLDVWIPECMFKVTANACVIYTGDKAITMYDAWKAKIFGK